MEKTGTFSHQNKILIHFGPGAGVKESSACRADWVNKRRLSGEKKSTTKLYTFLLPSLYVSHVHLYTFLVPTFIRFSSHLYTFLLPARYLERPIAYTNRVLKRTAKAFKQRRTHFQERPDRERDSTKQTGKHTRQEHPSAFAFPLAFSRYLPPLAGRFGRPVNSGFPGRSSHCSIDGYYRAAFLPAARKAVTVDRQLFQQLPPGNRVYIS